MQARDVHQLFHHYGLKPIKTNSKRETSANGTITYFSESSFNTIRYRDDFMKVLYNIVTFGDARGQESIYTPTVKDNKEQLTYKNDENDMEKHSQNLEKVYQMENNIKNMKKKIVISEGAFKRLFENTFNEDVFINSKRDNKINKKAYLHYSKNNGGYNKGNLNSFDMLKTDKMEQNNGDTYEVPLKGGIMSYNITSIKGVDVMHYFKNYFDNKATTTKINGEEYELDFEKEQEFKDFLNTFLMKVNNVVAYVVDKKGLSKNQDIDHISLYPVPSSSNFNEEMVKQISEHYNIHNFPTIAIDQNVLKKETNNIELDTDFIDKNKDYYSSQRYKTGSDLQSTHLQGAQTDLNRLKTLPLIKKQIEILNTFTNKENGTLLKQYYYALMKERENKLTEKTLKKLENLLLQYIEAYNKLKEISKYYNEGTKEFSSQHMKKIASAIKYSKGPSLENRKMNILDMLHNYGLGKGIYANNVPEICTWRPENFQIKKFGNDTRMALKNYFKPNEDEEFVTNEIEKTQNSILVIFDDNVSGGATLSDICLQLKNLGVQNIIPITFGEMGVSWGSSYNLINQPENGRFNMESVKMGNKNILTETDKSNMTILWLDDQRNPNDYFKKQKLNSGAWVRNNDYYQNNVFNQYSPNFVWVKNLKEFANYIMTNGLPPMISFDHDIKPKGFIGEHENGADCAQWLVNYCEKNNLSLPQCFVHSANKSKRINVEKILGIG